MRTKDIFTRIVFLTVGILPFLFCTRGESVAAEVISAVKPKLHYSRIYFIENEGTGAQPKLLPANLEYDDADYILGHMIYSEGIFCIYGREKQEGEKREDRFGYADRSGKLIADTEYEFAYPFSEGLGCVRKNGKYGFLNRGGEVAISFEYLDAAPFSEGLAYFATEETYGFMDKNGKPVFFLDCDSVSSFHDGLAYFSVDGKYGFLNQQGDVVIEAVYDDVSYFQDGIAQVRRNNLTGMIDSRGEEIVPVEYEYIWRGEGILDCVRENGTRDYYTFAGEKSTEEEYIRGKHAARKDWEYSLDGWKRVAGSKILLVNHITPRMELYWELTHGRPVEVQNADGEVSKEQRYSAWDEYNCRKIFKLFSVEGMEEPVLYCVEKPFSDVFFLFPLTDSAFYGISDDSLKLLLTGYECGGSALGDRVCFWLDTETGKILLGTRGAAGGFMGSAAYMSAFEVQENEVRIRDDLYWVSQSSGNYTEEELLENASHFFDEDDMPYTEETILEGTVVQEYEVNGQNVAPEVYRDCREKYKEVHILE